MAEATDIEDHPLRVDIELVLQLKVRGLEANLAREGGNLNR